ncbi:Uma2 family endonuclease [Tautonia sociabilis]|uniref:Uma2 family endonuclease n=1 Tax=Tautonia sociabilis TaxID=2080755 RepID=A0A432MNS3_9BACT|nr:Uma2 family endonuclease [Tautonia sociabilis]RUL89084.1 Uma2 family endonuclease [Tautonia sociabilis]
MASPADLETVRRQRLPDLEPAPPGARYDRSSIEADALVTIEGQTERDFFLRAPEDRYCEFIDGTVYMPSPVSVRHQELVGFWYVLLSAFCHERERGRVLTGPAVLRVAPDRDLEPDVFVAPAGAEPLPPSGLAMGEAVLVVEVLSPGNCSHDLDRKAAVYREARIPEIVYVDDRDKVLIVHRLALGDYETIRLGSGRWESGAVPGFWLDVSWLWGEPLPGSHRLIDAILAG